MQTLVLPMGLSPCRSLHNSLLNNQPPTQAPTVSFFLTSKQKQTNTGVMLLYRLRLSKLLLLLPRRCCCCTPLAAVNVESARALWCEAAAAAGANQIRKPYALQQQKQQKQQQPGEIYWQDGSSPDSPPQQHQQHQQQPVSWEQQRQLVPSEMTQQPLAPAVDIAAAAQQPLLHSQEAPWPEGSPCLSPLVDAVHELTPPQAAEQQAVSASQAQQQPTQNDIWKPWAAGGAPRAPHRYTLLHL